MHELDPCVFKYYITDTQWRIGDKFDNYVYMDYMHFDGNVPLDLSLIVPGHKRDNGKRNDKWSRCWTCLQHHQHQTGEISVDISTAAEYVMQLDLWAHSYRRGV